MKQGEWHNKGEFVKDKKKVKNMKLYPQDYEAPAVPPRVVSEEDKTSAKNIIKAYVTEPKEYFDIVRHVKEQMPYVFIDKEVIDLIEEIRLEWHPILLEPESPDVGL